MAKRGRDFSMEDSNSETDREESAEKIARKDDGAEVNPNFASLEGNLSPDPIERCVHLIIPLQKGVILIQFYL